MLADFAAHHDTTPSQRRALLVHADAELQELVTRVLATLEFDTTVCSDAAMALRWFSSHGAPDLVIAGDYIGAAPLGLGTAAVITWVRGVPRLAGVPIIRVVRSLTDDGGDDPLLARIVEPIQGEDLAMLVHHFIDDADLTLDVNPAAGLQSVHFWCRPR